MKFIKWDESYSVNIEEIDAQHQWLTDIINTLHEELQENKSKLLIGIIVKSLMQYIQVHFQTEEGLMKKFNYPDYETHKIQHKELEQKVLGWSDSFLRGKLVLTNEMLEFLKSWLENHEITVDRPLGLFLNSHGLR